MSSSGTAVVMSGGGAKAAAHLGAHLAIMEAGLTPARYVATSMGAVMSALFATGLRYENVLERVLSVRTGDVIVGNPLALLTGLYSQSILKSGPLIATLERVVPARRFGELKVPLTITATDFDSGELVLFGEGGREVPLCDALYATCALPVFYPPAIIEGKRYVDGGLRSVLPIEVAASFGPDRIVAVDTGPGFDEEAVPGAKGLPAIVQAHSDATGIMMAANTLAALALWRATPERPPMVYVRPRLPRGATFRVDLLRAFVEEGHRATALALQGK